VALRKANVSNIGRPEIAAIADWLIDGARSAAAPQQVLAVLCERLVAAGVPLWRAAVCVPCLLVRARENGDADAFGADTLASGEVGFSCWGCS
jgi:hypothetical protein